MNSTSLEPRHSRYSASTLPATADEAAAQQSVKARALNLNSSPKNSFKAPTAEDFNRGARASGDEPAPRSAPSAFATLWSKLFCRER